MYFVQIYFPMSAEDEATFDLFTVQRLQAETINDVIVTQLRVTYTKDAGGKEMVVTHLRLAESSGEDDNLSLERLLDLQREAAKHRDAFRGSRMLVHGL